ncbi:hypothetical protein J1N35_000988 [Gossypium stocksii]|uniref:Uncharacterized protein n=1 Tax=Gossypium stocksii TaxID=47602 RepID=A0A9D3WI82_9ROSI|nr:hypothetical protein J1N35_000988 [Gossypium stocksii]
MVSESKNQIGMELIVLEILGSTNKARTQEQYNTDQPIEKMVEVLMSENEHFMKPTRSIIGDTLYTKSTPTHQDEGANLKKEGVAHEYPEIEVKYEVAFLLQFSTPKKHVAQSPTCHALSTGGSSHQIHVIGKGKAPMEMRQAR